ncbi:unnamed protein product [Periconia digitata]|uniref:Uncharacterized protein n=1 Tax=Periconia digitata TaxID=1303443 RepID=A0A9W4U8C5_9PLEO|nr:unnamed protein product [Periconia digitata]
MARWLGRSPRWPGREVFNGGVVGSFQAATSPLRHASIGGETRGGPSSSTRKQASKQASIQAAPAPPPPLPVDALALLCSFPPPLAQA